MKLTLTIELGNDAMQSRRDVATAIERSLGDFDVFDATPLQKGETGMLRDENGNTVGEWIVAP